MSSSGPPAQERHEAVGVGPEEGHEDDQKAGASPLQQQAERIGALQTGEEKAPGRCYRDFEQPGLERSVPAYNRGLELDDLKGPFQPKPLYD